MSAIRNFEFILYVEDQSRARDFYSTVLGLAPSLDVPGMTSFSLEGATLGLMPVRGIRALLEESIPEHSDDARCELYLDVDDPAAFSARAVQQGATPLSPLQPRNWGDDVVYLSDLDHHIIAFAKRSR